MRKKRSKQLNVYFDRDEIKYVIVYDCHDTKLSGFVVT